MIPRYTRAAQVRCRSAPRQRRDAAIVSANDSTNSRAARMRSLGYERRSVSKNTPLQNSRGERVAARWPRIPLEYAILPDAIRQKNHAGHTAGGREEELRKLA